MDLLNNDTNSASGNANNENNTTNAPSKATFVTDPLDDEAMRELLEICQQYNDKFPPNKQAQALTPQGSLKPTTGSINSAKANIVDNCAKSFHRLQAKKATNCDNYTSVGQNFCNSDKDTSHTGACFRNKMSQDNCYDELRATRTAATNQPVASSLCPLGSIERLQNKQGEIQSQLEEANTSASELLTKQKRKVKGELDDEDDELLEFQQIEIELRISELSRQLSNIQEELRLRLYKRLLSKTTNGARAAHFQQSLSQASARRNSTEDSSPPSSSCSDEQATTSSTSTGGDAGSCSSPSFQAPPAVTQVQQDSGERNGSQQCRAAQYCTVYVDCDAKNHGQTNSHMVHPLNHQTGPRIGENNRQQTEEQSRIDTTVNDESKDMQMINDQPDGYPSISQEDTSHDIANNNVSAFNKITNSIHLERIEEDEEDEQDFYSNSDHMRTIYQEKLSPILQASALEEHSRAPKSRSSTDDGQYDSFRQNELDLSAQRVTTGISNLGFDSSNVNSAKRSNRPLTMYLPKPDEQIDLMEHIQSLGHDLSMISKEITLTPASAHGYLYKCCSSNNRKWLKRYFFFDRQSKMLAYYENSGQLVKKRSSQPRNIIPFDEISDVYVEHRLSVMDDKERGSRKTNYVFILATTKRKYMLASPNAETMRAWIDVLFTAAKANDYFQQLNATDNEDESFEFQNYPNLGDHLRVGTGCP